MGENDKKLDKIQTQNSSSEYMQGTHDAATKILSLISHKLKTPLSIINGYSEAILSQNNGKELSSFTLKALEDINKQGDKLSVLVDKLVRFSNANGLSRTEIKKDLTKVRDLFCKLSSKCILRDDSLNITSSENTIRTKGPFVDIKCEPDTLVYADPSLLSIALEELIDNAIRFNNNPIKKIRLFHFEEKDKDVLAVADNGVGIKSEYISKIFDKFYQVDDFFTGQIEGWGLGLALVKKIMTLHEGNITVRSQYGIGTIISLRFPKREFIGNK